MARVAMSARSISKRFICPNGIAVNQITFLIKLSRKLHFIKLNLFQKKVINRQLFKQKGTAPAGQNRSQWAALALNRMVNID